MISFNSIGNLGRLANQMFQYASLKGIAANHGYEYSIPPRNIFGYNDDKVQISDVIIYDVFNLEENNNIEITNNQRLPEKTHTFDKDLFDNCPDNVDLFGYYQTEKYFKHIEDQIRKDFTFKDDLLDMCNSFIQSNFSNNDVISLHIRRGDYITNPNHPVQTIEYYQKSLNKFPDLPVIVFSDDSQWCNEQEIFSSSRFSVSENNSTDADLCLMSLCKYHIIANSSFSWWGAWLAKSEKVIAPKNWFDAECMGKKIEDMSFGNFEFL